MEIARAYLEKASKRMKKWADKGRRDLEFKVGDLVLVKLMPEQFRSLKSKDNRFVRKYWGPVPVIAKVGKVAYKIAPSIGMKIHPVIHVSNLKPYHLNMEDLSRNQPTRSEVNLRRLEKRVAAEILAEREVVVRGCQRREFLVRWRGLGDEETS